MKIGILQFELEVPHARSLKDKRRVVRSLKDRLHREHMVAVAEVGALEVWNRAMLGLVCVAADGAYLRSVMSMDVLDAEQSLPETDEDGRPLWTPGERRDALPEGEAA
jgi:uncharacterized protein YlxP (DUF503 family)